MMAFFGNCVYSRTPVARTSSLNYDQILCDGQCFLFVQSLTEDHPQNVTNDCAV